MLARVGLLESHHAHPFPCQASHAPRISPHLCHGPRPGSLFLFTPLSSPCSLGSHSHSSDGLPVAPAPGPLDPVSWPGVISTLCPPSGVHENATPSKPAAPQSLTSPLALLVTTPSVATERLTPHYCSVLTVTIFGICFLLYLPFTLGYRLHLQTRPLFGALPRLSDSDPRAPGPEQEKPLEPQFPQQDSEESSS